MKQGTEEWKALRLTKVTASDAAVIYGCSPWNTPLKLWKQKLGRLPETEVTHAMQRGSDLEEEARNKFEDMSGLFVCPKVVFHPDNSWMMASLDGITPEGDVIVEIKCPGKETHEKARAGVIPEHYRLQILHQMACVPTVSKAIYFSYRDGEGILLHVERDEATIGSLIEKERDFYDCMITNTPPAETEDDIKQVEADSRIANLCKIYTLSQKAILEYEEQQDKIKEILMEHGDDGHIEFCEDGVPLLRMMRTNRQGNIDWKALCKAKNISTEEQEQYRGPSIGFYRFMVPKS